MSLNADELHVEDERGVRRDDAGGPLGPVAEVRGHGQLGSLPDRHLGYALVPATNHLALPQLEGEHPVLVPRRVELLPVLQGACADQNTEEDE